ncbi:MAG: helix-turn-helix domain-containing protein [Halobacteria archaeon]|nr:helix-turn-helix domain-containing protein [Halobacteria archaeon]
MTVDEDDAVDALKRLGLSEYEAKVFIALQKLGVGTARDIYRLTDVPRSQVYGAAESLEERGLVEIQKSKPMEYRPISLEEAKSRLEDRYKREQEKAFDYLEKARAESDDETEEREDFWTVQGRETIDDRIINLINQAEDRIIFSTTDASLITEKIRESLEEHAADSVDVYVVSEDRGLRDKFEDLENINLIGIEEGGKREDEGGRFLIVDRDTVLLSVLGQEELPGIKKETAIWSSDSNFASVIIQISEGWFRDAIQVEN